MAGNVTLQIELWHHQATTSDAMFFGNYTVCIFQIGMCARVQYTCIELTLHNPMVLRLNDLTRGEVKQARAELAEVSTQCSMNSAENRIGLLGRGRCLRRAPR